MLPMLSLSSLSSSSSSSSLLLVLLLSFLLTLNFNAAIIFLASSICCNASFSISFCFSEVIVANGFDPGGASGSSAALP